MYLVPSPKITRPIRSYNVKETDILLLLKRIKTLPVSKLASGDGEFFCIRIGKDDVSGVKFIYNKRKFTREEGVIGLFITLVSKVCFITFSYLLAYQFCGLLLNLIGWFIKLSV